MHTQSRPYDRVQPFCDGRVCLVSGGLLVDLGRKIHPRFERLELRFIPNGIEHPVDL
jgi:hypothetical protein